MSDIIPVTPLSKAAKDEEPDDGLPFFSLFEPTEECICEFGDIILNVDDGFHPSQKLRVSSCILAMSSKVFKALFSRKFAEGQAGASRSPNEPHEIVMKDLPTPLKRLCQMLHHQAPYDVANEILDPSALLDLALMADKYDVVEALRIQFEALLGRFMIESALYSDKDLHKLVAASVLLYQRSSFHHFTKELVVGCTKITANTIERRCLDLFPADLVSRLRDQQQEARQMLTTRTMKLIPQFSRACRVAERQILVHELAQNLTDAGLMPPDFKHLSLQKLLQSLDSVDIPIVTAKEVARKPDSVHYPTYSADLHVFDADIPSSPRSRRSSPAFSGSHQSYSRREEIDAPTHRAIRQSIDAVERVCRGICLVCIQPKDEVDWHLCDEAGTSDEDDDADSLRLGSGAWGAADSW